jgi:hypothetical protein
MQTLKVSVSLPGGSQQPNAWSTHPDIELHLSANDSDCDVVIALPLVHHSKPAAVTEARSNDAASAADDEYVLGGYAGI